MSRDDEIKAMAREICRTQNVCAICPHPSCRAMKYAERAYDAGYRKQSGSEQNNHGASEAPGITRFQKIKQMTVEEIAAGLNLICDCWNDCSSCPFDGNCPPLGFHDIDGWKEWLEGDVSGGQEQ